MRADAKPPQGHGGQHAQELHRRHLEPGGGHMEPLRGRGRDGPQGGMCTEQEVLELAAPVPAPQAEEDRLEEGH